MENSSKTKAHRAPIWLMLIAFSVAIVAIACSEGDGDPGAEPTNTPIATGTAGVATATSEARATATSQTRATSTSQAQATATSIALGTVGPSTATPSPTAQSSPTTPATAVPTATPSPTPTPVPPNGIARAGDDIDTRRGNFIGLNGSGSSDPDGDPLTFTWTQVNGPDVTGGVGRFIGPTPSFAVPLQVSTLVFDLTVNDGSGESEPDRVQINVFEYIDNPGLFVDGNTGSNETGDGTRENPFASIGYAINRINGPNQNIHVRSLKNGTAYEEPNTLSPPVTASLYGGYGPGWVRDVINNKTRVNGAETAVRFGNIDEEAWFSGFNITGANATSAGQNTFAVQAVAGAQTLHIEDNILRSGKAGNSIQGVNSGTSYGIWLGQIFNVVVKRNEIFAGSGGTGLAGSKGNDGANATTNGSNGSGGTGGGGGKGGNTSINGGRGGNGGGGIIPVDGSGGGNGGGPAGAGGIGDKVGAGAVGDGSGGGGGAGGNGGVGGNGPGIIGTNGLFQAVNGGNGDAAGNGGGGGGGGGGAGGVGLTGGGGGGGGGGGVRGNGGGGGTGGGASIGILIFKTVSTLVEDNTVVAAAGGYGANGGAGGTGGAGTRGGVGAPNECSFLGCDIGRSGDGGEGGGGGAGGIGGQGGGGAGGPSYGILVASGQSPVIKGNSISSGKAGNAGTGGAAGLGGSPGGNGGSTGGAGGCCAFSIETAGIPGAGGDGGWSYAVFDIDTNDGNSPELIDNDLVSGQAGVGRSIGGKPGQTGDTNVSP